MAYFDIPSPHPNLALLNPFAQIGFWGGGHILFSLGDPQVAS